MPRQLKQFHAGQSILVQRAPAAPWEPAVYLHPEPGWPGNHRVQLPVGAEHYFDSLYGGTCEHSDPRAVMTRSMIVPTRRIQRAAP
jgi:hypothetical protein